MLPNTLEQMIKVETKKLLPTALRGVLSPPNVKESMLERTTLEALVKMKPIYFKPLKIKG
jgi:hypothetical protein